MASRAVTITLELRQTGDELEGRVGERDFSGRLELLVAIDALLEAAPAETSSVSP